MSARTLSTPPWTPRTVPGSAASHEAVEGLQPVILVVDDDEAVREIVGDILVQAGYHVLRAGSGVDALALLGQTPEIALVVSDVVMPEMGGLELAKAAAQLRPDLSVAFMTGYSPRQLQSNAQILSKPFRIDGLLSFVAKALLSCRIGPMVTA